MDWRCGLALRLLHRPQRFHDCPLVFGFCVGNHLWHRRRDDGGTKFCGNGIEGQMDEQLENRLREGISGTKMNFLDDVLNK
jgi:hypothetical protein